MFTHSLIPGLSYVLSSSIVVTWGYLASHPNYLYVFSLDVARIGQPGGVRDLQIARVRPLAGYDQLEEAPTISRILNPGADHHREVGPAHEVRCVGVVSSMVNGERG